MFSRRCLRYNVFASPLLLHLPMSNIEMTEYQDGRLLWIRNETKVFYFAFGSNMLGKKIRLRGKINPISSSAAYLPGFRLAFPIRGMPPADPCFAAIIKVGDSDIKDAKDEREQCVHGVLWELSKEDYETLWRSEGGSAPIEIRPYIEENVYVVRYGQSEEKIRAVSLGANRFSPSALLPDGYAPSRRYARLMIDGATEAGLDAFYIQRLQCLPVVVLPGYLRWVTSRAGYWTVFLYAVIPPGFRLLNRFLRIIYGPPPGFTTTALRRPATSLRAIAIATVLLPAACVGGILELVGGALLLSGLWQPTGIWKIFLQIRHEAKEDERRADLLARPSEPAALPAPP